ncbi:hypothetical protein LCGC14_3137760, partial [marine sediment metagenome]
PSGALYKRGEDGIVLIDQQKCRAWRSCVAACPYKKTYFNWFTGKIEKCIANYIGQGADLCKGNDGFLRDIEAFGLVVLRFRARPSVMDQSQQRCKVIRMRPFSK